MFSQTLIAKVSRYVRSHLAPTSFDLAVRNFIDRDGDRTLRLDYPLLSSSLVFDLGGYKGQFASDIFAKHMCKVWVFEPIGEYAEAIQRRFSKNVSITVYPFGLGANNRSELFAIAGDRTSSLSIPSTGQRRASAQIRSVREFMEEHNVMNVDLLKINIEGGEYELLDALAGADLMRRFRFIQVQFHRIPTIDETALERYYKIISDSHDLQWSFRPFVWESWTLANPL